MATTLEKSRRRPGRPTREEEVRRALAELGLDPALLDPRRVLAEIASDKNAPASARVSAAKALLEQTKQPDKGKAEDRPSKRVLAQGAAATAGGVGSGWGDDLAWSSGGQPQ